MKTSLIRQIYDFDSLLYRVFHKKHHRPHTRRRYFNLFVYICTCISHMCLLFIRGLLQKVIFWWKLRDILEINTVQTTFSDHFSIIFPLHNDHLISDWGSLWSGDYGLWLVIINSSPLSIRIPRGTRLISHVQVAYERPVVLPGESPGVLLRYSS